MKSAVEIRDVVIIEIVNTEKELELAQEERMVKNVSPGNYNHSLNLHIAKTSYRLKTLNEMLRKIDEA